jgi:hypothetical protein
MIKKVVISLPKIAPVMPGSAAPAPPASHQVRRAALQGAWASVWWWGGRARWRACTPGTACAARNAPPPAQLCRLKFVSGQGRRRSSQLGCAACRRGASPALPPPPPLPHPHPISCPPPLLHSLPPPPAPAPAPAPAAAAQVAKQVVKADNFWDVEVAVPQDANRSLQKPPNEFGTTPVQAQVQQAQVGLAARGSGARGSGRTQRAAGGRAGRGLGPWPPPGSGQAQAGKRAAGPWLPPQPPTDSAPPSAAAAVDAGQRRGGRLPGRPGRHAADGAPAARQRGRPLPCAGALAQGRRAASAADALSAAAGNQRPGASAGRRRRHAAARRTPCQPAATALCQVRRPPATPPFPLAHLPAALPPRCPPPPPGPAQPIRPASWAPGASPPSPPRPRPRPRRAAHGRLAAAGPAPCTAAASATWTASACASSWPP